MKTLLWQKILAILGACLVIVGIYPFASCLWLAYAPRPDPFSMQFPPRKGEYTSPPIATGFGGPYRIDLEWPGSIPGDRHTRLDLDWEILDQKGRTVQQGSYRDWIAGNTICLAGYAPGYRRGQRVVIRLAHDVLGVGDSMRLKVSVDKEEISLDLSYGWGISIICAGIVAGPGALLLLVLPIRRMNQQKHENVCPSNESNAS
jgi:hypothetical protein